MNHQKSKVWEKVLIFAQIIYLCLSLIFVAKEKHPQALGLLIFSGVSIGLYRDKYSIVNFLDRIMWGIAIILLFHWYVR